MLWVCCCCPCASWCLSIFDWANYMRSCFSTAWNTRRVAVCMCGYTIILSGVFIPYTRNSPGYHCCTDGLLGWRGNSFVRSPNKPCLRLCGCLPAWCGYCFWGPITAISCPCMWWDCGWWPNGLPKHSALFRPCANGIGYQCWA